MILINSSTRQFNVPGADLVFGVTGDAGSAVKEFSCPRYVGNNLDLTGCFIRMNYRNANGEVDSYLVPEVTVDGDNVVFGWELSPKVTMYKGNVSFVMCVTGPDTKVAWHTTLGRGQVLEGLEPDSAMIEEGTADVVAALIAMVEAQTEAVESKGAEWVRNVQSEGTDQINAVQTAGKNAESDAVAEIEAKGVNTRNSIPADYTALSEAVDSVVRGKAPGIVCSAEGSAITVNDASDMAIQGMKIFGRSTQDGTPTPETPVEIKSVVEPVVMMGGSNLLDYEKWSKTPIQNGTGEYKDNGITITAAGDAYTNHTSVYCRVPCVPGVRYVLSWEHSGDPGLIYIFPNETGSNKIGVNTNQASKLEYVPDVGVTCFRFRFGVPVNGDVGVFKNIRINVGEQKEYEPYKPIQTLSITHTLPGIPVTSGGNYTDSNGQHWICDEVDLERGVYVQRIRTLELRGTESVVNVSGDYAITLVNPAFDNQDRVQCLCNYFPAESRRTVRDIANQAGALAVAANATYLRFVDNVNFAAVDVDAFKASLVEKHTNGNPVVVNYILATPIETPLSETEIAAYRALHTYKPNTAILNDSGAHMEVEYAADTKLYIDNKITALIGG